MTENNEATTPAEVNPNDVKISVEQICAAIINTLGSVEVKIEDLIANYSSKSIAVNQDEETKAVTFTLVDSPVAQDTTSEQESE